VANTNRANTNRWVDGIRNKNTLLITVASGTTVRIGDLMFQDNTDDLRSDGSSTANNFAYPISYLRISGASLELNKDEVKSRFLGVALGDHDGLSGRSNVNLSVAIDGKFTFPLKPSRTVSPDDMFGASGTTASSDMFDQKISTTSSVTQALGWIAERKVHAQQVEVFIRTFVGRSGTI